MNAFEKDISQLINDVEGFMKGFRPATSGSIKRTKAHRLWRVLDYLTAASKAKSIALGPEESASHWSELAEQYIASARAVLDFK